MPRSEPNRIFIWLVYAFTVVVWLFKLNAPALNRPGALVLFSLALLVGGALHSLVPKLQRPVHIWLYVIGQTLLIAVAVVAARDAVMVPSLFFAVVGEAIGLLRRWPERLTAMVVLLAGWFGSMALAVGIEPLGVYAVGAALGCIFVSLYVVIFTRQAEATAKAEDLATKLEAANAQLRAYAVRVADLSVTEERQRMARELHDTLAQGLAGLIMQLEAVDHLLAEGDTARARQITGRAMTRARATLTEARTAIQALRSPLDRGDLLEAVRREIDSFRAESNTVCVLEAGPGELRLSSAAADQLYRTVQEGLANIARHSRATHAKVHFSQAGDTVTLEIADNGVGFDPDQVPAGHFGLLGLQERVQLTGGTLQIESRPGAGTRLIATLPATAATEEA